MPKSAFAVRICVSVALCSYPGANSDRICFPIDFLAGSRDRDDIVKMPKVDETPPIVSVLKLVVQDQIDDLRKSGRNVGFAFSKQRPYRIPVQPFDVLE